MYKLISQFKLSNNAFLELTCLSAVVLTQLLLAQYVQGFTFLNDGHDLRRFAILLSVMPVVTLYIVTRFLLPPLVSAVLVASALTIISIINHVKTALTNIPISYGDLVNTGNISIIGHYISLPQILMVIGFFIIIGLTFAINPYRKTTKTILAIQILILLVAAPLSLYPYSKNINANFGKKVSFYFNKVGTRYVAYSWAGNVKENGLPIHLVQTSVSNAPDAPTREETAAFDALLLTKAQPIKRPNSIIVILCEACWHDATHFNEPFSKLTDLGFKPLRAVSPSYGGNTVNASFELHTGLPANGMLSGVIYTEYSHLFSDHVHTFAQHLRKISYSTSVAHNHIKTFWRRNIIKPKFGFDRFVSIEDMSYTAEPNSGHLWPRDKVLFDSALKVLDEKAPKKFLFLISVYTHGDYVSKNDHGETDYFNRLSVTVADMADFAKKAIEKDPNTLIFMVGDHKPALTKYFYDNQIIPKDQFNLAVNQSLDLANRNEDFLFSLNASTAIIGDISAYIYHSDSIRVDDFIKKANGKPFFCISQILNESFAQVNVPAFQYAKTHHICEDYTAETYKATVDKYPSWLYSLSLFDKR